MTEVRKQLDLVFLVDTTGSMGQYLNAATTNISNIMNTIKKQNVDLRIAIVEYKDHKNKNDSSYPERHWDFMEDENDILNALRSLSAWGGGMDGPESVACAFNTAVELEYRDLAAKVIVWVADAPPHGFDIQYDAYPEGCPCGTDFQEVALKAVQKDIQVYSVACEPIRSIYKHFRDLMRAVAQMTGGQFCPLVSADALADVIIGGSLEEVGMNLVIQKIECDMENLDGFETMTQDEKDKIMRKAIGEYCEKHPMKQLTSKSIYKGEMPPIPKIYFTATSMAELRAVIKTREPSIYEFKDGVNLVEYNPAPQGFWDKSGRSAYNRQNQGWGRVSNKEVKMEMCDDDDYEEYQSSMMERRMETEEQFTREDMVDVREDIVREERRDTLFARLQKKLKK